MIKYDRFWETLKKRHISQYYLINECGIRKRLLRRLRDNENVEIFFIRPNMHTVLNCDLDDIVEYVPNNPDIIEDAKTAQKEAAASHPVHTPSGNNWCFRLPKYKPCINYTCLSSDKHVFEKE